MGSKKKKAKVAKFTRGKGWKIEGEIGHDEEFGAVAANRIIYVESLKEDNPKLAIGAAKVSLSVIPPQVLAQIGLAMMEGANKYGAFNWRKAGAKSSVYYDATMRHLMAYWEGADLDPDSGISHLVKAIASLVVWSDAVMQDKCTDDRPPIADEEYWLENANMDAESLAKKGDVSGDTEDV